MSEHEFIDAVYLKADDLPDHYAQEIKDLTSELMVSALVDLKTKEKKDPNVGLAALQRALGLTIAKMFPKEVHEEILDGVLAALKASVKEWADT